MCACASADGWPVLPEGQSPRTPARRHASPHPSLLSTRLAGWLADLPICCSSNDCPTASHALLPSHAHSAYAHTHTHALSSLFSLPFSLPFLSLLLPLLLLAQPPPRLYLGDFYNIQHRRDPDHHRLVPLVFPATARLRRFRGLPYLRRLACSIGPCTADFLSIQNLQNIQDARFGTITCASPQKLSLALSPNIRECRSSSPGEFTRFLQP